MSKKTQYEIDIEHLTNGASEFIEYGAEQDRDTMAGSQARSDCMNSAMLTQLHAVVQGLLFVGDQIRNLNQTIFEASIGEK